MATSTILSARDVRRLLSLCEELATEHFATHYRKSDTEEPTFDGSKVTLIPEIEAALQKLSRADLLTLSLDEEHGGMQLPRVVASACMAWFTAAKIGTAAYSFLTIANAGQCSRTARPSRSSATWDRCWRAASSAP